MIQLTITGPIPSKKNQLMPRKGNKGYFNPKARELRGIVQQIVWQVGNIAPIDKPSITMDFTCSNARGDIDGKAVTVLDALVKSGLLINDNLKHFTGPLTIRGRKDIYDECVVQINPS